MAYTNVCMSFYISTLLRLLDVLAVATRRKYIIFSIILGTTCGPSACHKSDMSFTGVKICKLM